MWAHPSYPTHSYPPLSPTLILRLENKPLPRTHTNSHTHTNIQTQRNTHTDIQTFTLIHTETHTLNTHTPTNIHTDKHTPMHTQTLIHTNTNTHTLIPQKYTHSYTHKHSTHREGGACEDHMEKEGQRKKEYEKGETGKAQDKTSVQSHCPLSVCF